MRARLTQRLHNLSDPTSSKSPIAMHIYQYSKLSPGSKEIRLLRLHPGRFPEPIEIEIFHQHLPTPGPPDRRNINDVEMLERIQKTLPDGWEVRKSINGRFAYLKGNSQSTWIHPVDGFDITEFEKETNGDFAQEVKVIDYESLSYCWGEATEMAEVLISNSPDPATEKKSVQKVAISSTLAWALRYLRRTDRFRVLWVDALCINQEDASERSEQVRRMADIYRSAVMVVIWLGESANNSEAAMDAFRYIGQQVELSTGSDCFQSPEADEKQWNDSTKLLPYDKQIFTAMATLTERPWFTRLWVYQELQLARTAMIQCGYQTVPWSLFRGAAVCVYGNDYIPAYLRTNLDSTARIAISKPSTPLLTTIMNTSTRLCKDPRDKIYGILGFTPADFVIHPDYSNSVERVYHHAAIAYTNYFCRLDLLRLCNLELRHLYDLPSWAPDLSHPVCKTGYFPFEFATGASRAEVQFDGQVMKATGIQFSHIAVVMPQIPQDDDQAIELIRRLEPAGLRERRYVDDEPLAEAYAALLCHNYSVERFPGAYITSFEEWKRQEIANPFFGQKSQYIPWTNPTWYEDRCLSHLKDQRIFITENGYMGRGPGCAQQGIIHKTPKNYLS